ncbi:MAG: DUF5050 domain-containing protein [Vallitalea sp.]|jgi:hypothetical protein|nr:DUF5050 domain-containing protein [Vallitalea sp.]
MTNYTQNLNLYKIDPLKDGNKTFNINTILNDNWDKIDIKHKQQETRVNQNKDKTIILRNDIGDKSALNTTDKSNLVSAVNEVSASMADIAYKTASGTANAITISKQGFTLTDGQYIEFKTTSNNTGNMTIKVNNEAVKSLRNEDGEQLSNGDIEANKYYKAIYNSNNDFFLLAPKGGGVIGIQESYIGTEIDIAQIKKGQYVYCSDNTTLDDGSVIGDEKLRNLSTYAIFIYNNMLYASYDDAIWKSNLDGSSPILLTSVTTSNIFVYDEYVYYTDDRDGNKLYKMTINGENNTKLSDKKAREIRVYSDYVYYRNSLDNEYLYRVKIDGTNETKLNSVDSRYMYIYKDDIFYINMSDRKMYKLNTVDLSITKINDAVRISTSKFEIHYGYIFFSSSSNSYYVSRMKTDGSGYEVITENYSDGLIVSGGYIYYRHGGDHGYLYRTTIDGKDNHKLSNNVMNYPLAYGRYVYYCNSVESSKLYRYIDEVIIPSVNKGIGGQGDTQFQVKTAGVLKTKIGNYNTQITGFISKKPIGWKSVDLQPIVKTASGTFTSNSISKNFTDGDGYTSADPRYYCTLDLSTIGFEPKKIIIQSNPTELEVLMWTNGDFIQHAGDFSPNAIHIVNHSQYEEFRLRTQGIIEFPVNYPNANYKWIAYGGEE